MVSAADVQVVVAFVASWRQRLGLLRSLLSNAERVRAEAFRHAGDADAYILAHGLLRLLLGARLGVDPTHVRIDRTPSGKPFLAAMHARPAPSFSLSHSRAAVAIAIGIDGPVGVDIEQADTSVSVDELRRLAATTFGPALARSVVERSDAEIRDAFCRGWTRHEAVGKAAGVGLVRADISDGAQLGAAVSVDFVAETSPFALYHGWVTCDLPVEVDCFAAVAFPIPRAPIRVSHLVATPG